MRSERWNHNLHYHPLILDAVPPGGDLLDVGCGEGILARQLSLHARSIVGVDVDASSIDLARATTSETNVEYLCADVLRYPFESASFDAVVSVATLHHLGTETGLLRMRELVRPGGVLAIVGLASSELPRDLPKDIAAAVATRVYRLSRTYCELRKYMTLQPAIQHSGSSKNWLCDVLRNSQYWEHSAPKVWNSPASYREVRRISERCLPGVSYRRHLLWRFSLVWRKPFRAARERQE